MSQLTTHKLQLGDILVQEGWITQDQLDEAIAAQKETRDYKPLGEICVERNWISKNELKKILRQHRISIRLGDLLTNLGLVTEEQVTLALEAQNGSGKKLGQLLLDKGFISEDTLTTALSLQLGLPKIVPEPRFIDRSLLKPFNVTFLRKYNVLPLAKEGKVLTLLMADPLDTETIRQVTMLTQCTIEPAIAPPTPLLRTINLCFQPAETPSIETAQNYPTLTINDKPLLDNGDQNATNILDYIISTAIEEGASDIHIDAQENGLRIQHRLDGILQHMTDIPKSLGAGLVSRIKILAKLDITERRRHQDGRMQAKIRNREFDLRVSTYVGMHGESVVFRVLSRENPHIDIGNLGLTPWHKRSFKELLDKPSGIILVTGPTGSGKTTTLYAGINYLKDKNVRIITAEDPVEYCIDGIVQGQMNPNLNVTYADFIKAMMRQDPDVILVGEIRERTSAEAAIQCALTGHKVMTSFHTEDSTGALLRLMDMGIETFLISSTVISVLAQRLVRVLCTHCKRPYQADAGELLACGVEPYPHQPVTLYKSVGCSKCKNTGYNGRMGIHEHLVVSDEIRAAILERKHASQIRTIARNHSNMVTIQEDGFYKALKGITTLSEIQRVAFHNDADKMFRRFPHDIVTHCEGVITTDSTSRLTLPSLSTTAVPIA